MQLGKHLTKSCSTNQAVIALAPGEAEYYGLPREGLWVWAILGYVGVHLEEPMEIKTDATAAIGTACRIGIEEIRHIEVNQLRWPR